MRQHNVPVLVIGLGGWLHASHLPAMVQEEGEQVVIDMHMAHANAKWREFCDEDVVVVSSGPHAYVSPRWYEDSERVPTWNYAAVHAYGVPSLITDKAAKHASQRRLVAAMDPPWLPKVHSVSEGYVNGMLNGILHFQIPVPRI